MNVDIYIVVVVVFSRWKNSTYIKRCIGCVFQSNAAVIRISHISAQSSLTSECWWLMLLMLALLLLGCTGAPVKMHGMQYTSHALKLIDWHFNNCLWMKYWREFQKVKKKHSEHQQALTKKGLRDRRGREIESWWKCKLGRSFEWIHQQTSSTNLKLISNSLSFPVQMKWNMKKINKTFHE